MNKKFWAGSIVVGALVTAALACAAPDVESGPATGQAVQQTVIAELTNANFQLTPDDSLATKYAGDFQTNVALGVANATTIAQATIDAAVLGTLSAGGGPTQAPVPTITLAATEPPVQAQPTATFTTAPAGAPGTGAISGKVCYPSSSIPPLTIYVKNLGDGSVLQQENAQDQSQYTMANLPEGDYYVFAYTHDAGIGIGYTQFVLCGLLASCTDHTMIAVPVNAGETTAEVDICDGYSASAIPPKP